MACMLVCVLCFVLLCCCLLQGEESAPEEEAQDEGVGGGGGEATPPVVTTISQDAFLRACGNYVYSFKTKMSLEEVLVVKAAVLKCSEDSGSSEWLASAFLEALLEGQGTTTTTTATATTTAAATALGADVGALWSHILNPLIAAVGDDTPEGKSISEATFKARRAAQNWSKATGLTQSEMAVILEAFESLDPNTWYQGGSVGKQVIG